MLIHDKLNFNVERDPIKTERSVFEAFKNISINQRYDSLPLYVGIPLAYGINNFGIAAIQNLINEINLQYKQQKIYVCQHIYVNKINFGDNFVFTPHATEQDDYIVIPHYNSIYSEKINDKPKTILCSFMGDYNTNSIRKELEKFKSENIIIQNTNGWFFQKQENEKLALQEKYKNLLETSYFSFCPHGTGPSTLRLFESISVGSFPIIFNNLKIPKLLKPFVIVADINNINFDMLKLTYTEELRQQMLNVYWNNYSNDKIYRSVLNYFNLENI